jgi:hypothetical protein
MLKETAESREEGDEEKSVNECTATVRWEKYVLVFWQGV